MNCKGCGKELPQGEAKQVAEWHFCDLCFEDLLNKPQGQALTLEDRAPDPEPAEAKCQMCGAKIEDDTQQLLGMWKVCDACKNDLSFKPTEPEVVEEEEEVDEDPDERERDLLNRPIHPPGTKIPCAGCGRTIFAVAAKVVDGESFCPDCHSNVPPPAMTPKVRTVDRTGVGIGFSASVQPKCAACDASSPDVEYEKVDSFVICKACLGTDRELALRIARKRHLEKLQNRKQ